MVDISRMNKLECVPQPVEARISENAPRGARERTFSSSVPPSGRKSKARPWTPFSEQLADLPSPPAGQQQQESPLGWCGVGTSRKNTTDLDPFSPRCCWGGPLHGSKTHIFCPPTGSAFVQCLLPQNSYKDLLCSSSTGFSMTIAPCPDAPFLCLFAKGLA